VKVKYAFICGEEGNYPIDRMCVWSKVSRSGYYEWRDRAPSATSLRRQRLAVLVRWSFDASEGTYGYRRVHAQLARGGHYADAETIRSIMRELGLVACQPRPWRPTTTIAGDVCATKDLLRRDFTASAPATKLVGDITCIRTWEGWLYLATVLDCCTKKVVGYAMADHMRTSLIIEALAQDARPLDLRFVGCKVGVTEVLAVGLARLGPIVLGGQVDADIGDRRPALAVRITAAAN
jgi:putative transposase